MWGAVETEEIRGVFIVRPDQVDGPMYNTVCKFTCLTKRVTFGE